MSGIKQEQTLKLGQKLSPKQILFAKLLEVPTIQLEQRIQQELAENPALDIADDDDERTDKEEDTEDEYVSEEEGENPEEMTDYGDDMEEYFSDDEDSRDALYRNISNHAPDDEVREMPIVSKDSFLESLEQQLGLFQFDEDELQIARYILGNIDESGYLQRNAREISNDLLFNMNIKISPEKVQDIIQRIAHQIEPAGVCAINLQECLLLQLERHPQTPENDLATRIVTRSFAEFTKKSYDRIRQKHRCTPEEFKAALNILVRLNPKPGAGDETGRASTYISPDFIVYYNDKTDKFELSLPKYHVPELCVRKVYKGMYEELRDSKHISKEERRESMEFLKKNITSAEWFIELLSQREHTLYRTMECIVEYQRTFFQTGDETTIKPMILKNIAEKVEMNISTISRITSSKYVQTPFGMYPLKFFFSESMEKEGEEVSSREVKKIIQDTIQEEDKENPLTDDDLRKILEEKGYAIARRTVAKYREQLGFAPSRMRK